MFLHTVRPAIWMASEYSSPLTEEPCPRSRLNRFPRSCEVELADGSYRLCPSQLESHFAEGRKRSLLPVSKATVYFNRQAVALTVMR